MPRAGTAYHPDFGQLVNYQAIPLSPNPDAQVAQTIDLMRQYVKADSGSEPILRDAAELRSCGDAFWMAKGVSFQRDEATAAPLRSLVDDDVVEVLIRPRDLANMQRPVEDCDGFATLTAARLRARGVPCSFVTVAADAREPDHYSHVYLACYPNGQRIALDTSHGPYPGWEAPNMFGKKREWPIDGPNWGELALLAAILAAVWFAATSWGWL